MSLPLLRQGDSVDRMAAEFNAILTASFDNIGSRVALDSIHPLSPTTTTLSPPHSSSPSSSEKNPTRRSAASFFRKVKSHASSLLASQQLRLDAAAAPPLPARSFVPSLPAGPSYPQTSTPLPSTPPRIFLTRTLEKQPHTSDTLDLDPIRYFLDHNDNDNCVDRCVTPPPTRRITSAPARANLRPSIFASAPVIFGLSSRPVSTPHSITEKLGVVRTVSRVDSVHETSKAPLRLKLRKKLSLPKIASRSHHSPPSSGPSQVTPSHYSRTYSAFPADFEHSLPCCEFFGDRSITPEEDPFRKDEVSPHLLSKSRLPSSSRSGSFDSDSETDHQIPGSHTLPALSSRWSSGSDSPSSSPSHARGHRGRGPSPTQRVSRVSPSLLQGPSRSPLSVTFPLPPSAQESVPLPGVTERVTTSNPAPPLAYPPPPNPPPSGPLPCPPPVDAVISSLPLSSPRLQEDVSEKHPREDFGEFIPKPKSALATKTQRRRPYLNMDKPRPSISFPPRNIPAKSPLDERSDAAKSKQQKSGTRRRGRPLTPYPLLFPTGRMGQDTMRRLEASKAVTRYSGPCNNSAFDQSADVIPDSKVEPDLEFDSDKARKKMSFSSATSAQTIESSTSTTSVSTTTSFVSVVTSTTVATTVSPSTSPPMSAIKPHLLSQVLDEEGRVVDTTTYNTGRTIPPVDFDVQSSGIYIKQEGAMRDAQSDLFLTHGEQVMIGASGWTEFRNHSHNCRDITFFLSGNHYGNSVVDASVVEFQRGGKTCGVELQIIARTSGPKTSADFPGHIPGTYPPSSDPPSLLPDIPRIPPIDIFQSSWSEWMGSALGLEGVPPAQDTGRPTSPSPSCSGSRPGGHLDWVHEGGTRHRTILAFTTALPTTLRDLAKRAGEMSLLDGVVIP
ncbi:hypothetical protein BC827DRAFT_1154065 [Russula dissimulans]|nr:hypothetical protein BC827DRAFT_1154065 [Russula dissimulans]